MDLRSTRKLPVAVGVLLFAATVAPAASWDLDALVALDHLRPRGETYAAEVPDTLDLAQHARWALNNQIGNLEPDQAYCVYQVFKFDNPPEMAGLTWNLPAKNARVLPLLRVMCGSDQGLATEQALMRTLLEQIADDGLMYVPVDNDGAPKGTAYPLAAGILVQAALNWYERDGNPAWKQVMQAVTDGLKTAAIRVEDRAYYPPESGYRDGQWVWTLRGQAKIPYQPPDEPYLEQQGLEGCVKYEQAACLRALALNYRDNHDPACLDLAEAVTRFCLKPGMWEDTSDQGYPGNEHGIFAGHFHGNVTALHSLLDVALVLGDQRLMQIVREAYDHGRRTGVLRMGWFPGWLRPEAHHRPASLYLASETCGVSDMLLLAVKLTDAGLGDYWDDVDAIVRNHLIAQQIIDLSQMRRLAGGPEHDAVLERFRGGFNQQMEGWINSTGAHMWGCCSANGAMGLYYAWHGITRCDDGVATVNLWLNRAAPWLDVDSYLPYEGKLVIHNKQAHTVLVRLPAWLDRDRLACRVNTVPRDLVVTDNRLHLAGLEPGDTVELTCPVPTSEDRYTVGGRTYTVTFRGPTVIDVQPRDDRPNQYQYYLRDHLRGPTAPRKTVTRFVAEKTLPLQ